MSSPRSMNIRFAICLQAGTGRGMIQVVVYRTLHLLVTPAGSFHSFLTS